MVSKSDLTAGIVVCCCFCLPFTIILVTLYLAIPIFLLTVGIVKENECPADPRIPIWMICAASLLLLNSIVETCAVRTKNPSLLVSISRSVMLTSTSVGCIFVFSSFSVRDGCDGLLYWTAFVYCIISSIGFSLLILLVCCGCCVLPAGIALDASDEV